VGVFFLRFIWQMTIRNEHKIMGRAERTLPELAKLENYRAWCAWRDYRRYRAALILFGEKNRK
jgi:hypothetical protein